MNSLKKNGTYGLVEHPKGRKALRNKWVLELKKDGHQIVKYKARVVVKRCAQEKGIDFSESFSPGLQMSSIRVVLEMVSS